jgi:regulator of extracellular matrix RemA (YlzA/DUF370 family)
MDKYYWSFNREQEIYRNGADTIKECIDEARKDNELHHRMYGRYVNEFIYIGESELYLLPVVSSDIILEQFRENAYDNCGEAAEDWLFSHSREQEVELDERLTEVMVKWIKETGQEPSFLKFKSIKKYSIETGLEVN